MRLLVNAAGVAVPPPPPSQGAVDLRVREARQNPIFLRTPPFMVRAAFGAKRPAGGAQLGESRLPPVVAPGGHWWIHSGLHTIGWRGPGGATWHDRTIRQGGGPHADTRGTTTV